MVTEFSDSRVVVTGSAVLDESVSMPSIGSDQLIANTEMQQQSDELKIIHSLRKQNRLHEKLVKLTKRRSAGQSLNVHEEFNFDSKYEAIGVASEAIAAIQLDDLDGIAEYIRKYFSHNYDSYRWQCVIVDRVNDIGSDSDHDHDDGGYCFFSVQGLTFLLMKLGQEPKDDYYDDDDRWR
ncbi:hypothetical protein HDE_01582 [Halotydeus destructor]|nr:hypothetical protein HDE_01582 [Halotydeus destructor]